MKKRMGLSFGLLNIRYVTVFLCAMIGGGCAPVSKTDAVAPVPNRLIIRGDSLRLQWPTKILIMDIQSNIYRQSDAGINETRFDLAQAAQQRIMRVLVDYSNTNANLKFTNMPTLSAAQKAKLYEHVALFNVVGAGLLRKLTQINSSAGEVQSILRSGGFTLGTELGFLKTLSGAPVAVTIFNYDIGVESLNRPYHNDRFEMLNNVKGKTSVVVGLFDLSSGNIIGFAVVSDPNRRPENELVLEILNTLLARSTQQKGIRL